MLEAVQTNALFLSFKLGAGKWGWFPARQEHLLEGQAEWRDNPDLFEICWTKFSMSRTALSRITARLRGINTHMNRLADLLSSRVKAEVFRLLFGPADGEHVTWFSKPVVWQTFCEERLLILEFGWLSCSVRWRAATVRPAATWT
jgi:hypothetical protein